MGGKIMRIKAQISSSKLSRVRAGVSNNSKFINNFGCLIFLSVSYFDVLISLNLNFPGSIFINNFTVTKRFIHFPTHWISPGGLGNLGGLT